jgi:ABC-type lipoprotein export system ATPase subunit
MIKAKQITKLYQDGTGEVHAVDSADLDINEGDFVLIVGRSGSGKSTLLSVLGGLTRPSSGNVVLDERDIWSLSDSELSSLRANDFGFVFQFSGLIQTLNTLENVMLPAIFSTEKRDVRKRATELLESLGIGNKAGSYPSQLSGGEMKRVAIARSLINDPRIILADEPTGDLDVDTEREIMELLRGINRTGKTVMVVTHNPELALYAGRVLRMEKGKITEITTRGA